MQDEYKRLSREWGSKARKREARQHKSRLRAETRAELRDAQNTQTRSGCFGRMQTTVRIPEQPAVPLQLDLDLDYDDFKLVTYAQLPKFEPFPKVARYSREVVITEKLDGTNASIYISDDASPLVLAGSRTRWLTPDNDNYGFARWVNQHAAELLQLGPGHHFGEWWGVGINRGYHLHERRFSLFNTARWSDPTKRPRCCHVVPTLWTGNMDQISIAVDKAMSALRHGSFAAPGYENPEGIVVFHTAQRSLLKKTFERDEGKGTRSP